MALALALPAVAGVTVTIKEGKDATDNFLKLCSAYVQVWSMTLCVTDKKWNTPKGKAKIQHAANVWM